MRQTTRTVLAATALTISLGTLSRAQQTTPPIKVEKEAPGAHSMEHMGGWKELDAYHTVMMGVWHPAKESNDLKPIRAQAEALATAGDTLAKAAVPKACDTPANRTAVDKVRTDSRALATLVKAGSDTDVMAALKALHERFEVVNRGCVAKT